MIKEESNVGHKVSKAKNRTPDILALMVHRILYYYDRSFTHATKKFFRQLSKNPINREKFISGVKKNRCYALCEVMVVIVQ